MRYVYVIYDIFTFEIWEVYFTEEECIDAFTEKYDGFKNIDWIGMHLNSALKFIVEGC